MPCQSFTPVALLVPEMTEPQPASKGLDKPAAAGQSDPPVENLPDSGHMSGGKSSESRGSSPEDEFDEAPPPAGAEGGRGARREGLEREITKQVAEKVEADAKAEVAVSGGVSNSGSNAGSDSEPEDPDLASEDEGAGPPSILDRVEDALDPSCQDLAQITKAIDDAEADGCSTHPAFKALLEKRDHLVPPNKASESEEEDGEDEFDESADVILELTHPSLTAGMRSIDELNAESAILGAGTLAANSGDGEPPQAQTDGESSTIKKRRQRRTTTKRRLSITSQSIVEQVSKQAFECYRSRF